MATPETETDFDKTQAEWTRTTDPDKQYFHTVLVLGFCFARY